MYGRKGSERPTTMLLDFLMKKENGNIDYDVAWWCSGRASDS